MTEPTDNELDTVLCNQWPAFSTQATLVRKWVRAAMREAIATWGTPQQEAQEPCPTCIALARTVMLDQVSFDRTPDCYGIRQITDDEGVEEWEDIRTSPDVAREEANDMMATGRGEIYEVVPLWTTPRPTQAQAGAVPLTDEEVLDAFCRTPGIHQFVQAFWAGVRFAEQHHDIKGGQHGTE